IRVLDANKYPNWLEIEPPDDSVSYVDSRYVLPNPTDPRSGIVTVLEGESLPVYAGGMDEATEPKVERAKLPRGSMVLFAQNRRKVTNSSGVTLVQIGSWKTEVRYIKASALGPAPGTQVVSAVGGQAGSGLLVQPAVGQGATGPDPLVQKTQRLSQQTQANPNLDPGTRAELEAQLRQIEARLQGSPAAPVPGAATQMPGHPDAVA